MAHTIINPDGLHDPTGFGYSHVARTSGDLVFIAGQYASDSDGRVTSQDFAEQVDRSLDNLRTALTAVGLGYEDVVQLRTHNVGHDAAKLEVLANRTCPNLGLAPANADPHRRGRPRPARNALRNRRHRRHPLLTNTCDTAARHHQRIGVSAENGCQAAHPGGDAWDFSGNRQARVC
jgi:enamine deaminase RidA (YjgF/YER057c/UK114 family)